MPKSNNGGQKNGSAKNNRNSSGGKCGHSGTSSGGQTGNSGLLTRLTPQQIAVIAGILTNSLYVDAIQIDKDQLVQIILVGSLRRKTDADKMLQQLNTVSIGDMLDSIMRQYR